MAFDTAGRIVFTAQWSNSIGRLDPRSGRVEVLPVPVPQARPYGIVLAKNMAYVNLFGANRIGVVDLANWTLRTVALPRAEARSRRIVVSATGDVWYVDHAGGRLGRLGADGKIEEWPKRAQTGAGTCKTRQP